MTFIRLEPLIKIQSFMSRNERFLLQRVKAFWNFNGIGLKRGTDSTQPADYDVEVELPEEVGQEALR